MHSVIFTSIFAEKRLRNLIKNLTQINTIILYEITLFKSVHLPINAHKSLVRVFLYREKHKAQDRDRA
jgi:uncharacterized protein (UPF0128 family)